MNKADLAAAGESNIGLARKTNEDNFCLLVPPERRTVFAMVADGLGGHHDGALASFICCRDLFYSYIVSDDERDLATPAAVELFLRREIEALNRKIFQRNYTDDAPCPMGSTIVGGLFATDFLVMFNVGDSRFYRFNPESGLTQVSTDHTLKSDPELRESLPRCCTSECLDHVVSRAIGTSSRVEPQIAVCPRRPGDRYLICSDGAYRYFSPERLAAILSEAAGPRQAVSRIMRDALLGGGHDNISAVALFAETATE